MNKLLLISILLILGVSLVSINLVSAGYSNDPFNHRYQGDPHKSSASNYEYRNIHDYSYSKYNYDYSYSKYNIANTASRPIFKGPYGNYRYEMYAAGDVRPNYFFRSYGLGYGSYPYFSGGYGYGGHGLGYGGSYYSYYSPGPYFSSYLF